MAKRFILVCAGIFLLAFAYHLGATNAEGQGPANPVVAAPRDNVVFMANGDVYYRVAGWGTFRRVDNIFSAAATAPDEARGAGKERYPR